MDRFYVVHPTPTLLSWLKEKGVPAWLRLDRPHLWSQREVGDHDYEGQGEDEQTFLKLAVLASFMNRADDARPAAEEDTELETARVLTGLLGAPPLTVETFDRWWTLERAEALSSVESTLAHTPVRILRKVQGPDARRDGWRLSRSVGERWTDVIRAKEEDAPRLQCAVSWVLECLGLKTANRVCVLRIQPFSLDAPIEEVLHVPGWTLQRRSHDLREGVKLILEDFTWGDDAWTFTYRVHEGERGSASSGTVRLLLEKGPRGWAVQSGAWRP
ncbi:hypothetical protein [Corallococcus sp. EGB]|uniref:hypothetical protein n=1 Tax=Corallococcus sp. EGB TaxID=1521117 RepID=UPI001CBDAD6D|nr:hypothetical protein [Corallococcus sp. EGB]